MAKITTIIDIGSNSCRMVVFKKSSRFAFSLLNESKAKVKLAQDSYKFDGHLQEVPMQRTFETLKSFLKISKSLKSRKILCVATSALRDAPNANEFKSRVFKELGLNIKIIDGEKEAFFGAVSAINLLHLDSFLSIDIGGGSTEFALVKDKKIIDTISLDIGAVRINELLEKSGEKETQKYISNQLIKLKDIIDDIGDIPLVTIGGTSRALAKLIIKQKSLPLGSIHGFEYDTKELLETLSLIDMQTSTDDLGDVGIKSDRLDTIQSGSLILKNIIKVIGDRKVVASGVGVREGVYLADLLRNAQLKFPANFDMSVRSLTDRFSIDDKQSHNIYTSSKKLYEILSPMHNLKNQFLQELLIASKLSNIGNFLSFYKYSHHSFGFILNGLQYGFSHNQRVLIAFIVKSSKSSLPSKHSIEEFKSYLPEPKTLKWLSAIISLSIAINSDFDGQRMENIKLEDDTLIFENSLSFLIKENIKKIELPKEFKIKFL
jgi:exopolyphosphatase/guanosine-5'-triphosphate,3'-diphosphate pyrophosphatase